MHRFRRLLRVKSLAGLFGPVMLALVLLSNLVTPFAPLASYSIEVAGLDDSNSVVICTDDGWERISFAELGIESAADLDGEYCAQYCSLCIIALSGHVILSPEFEFSLSAHEAASRLSVQKSQAILAAVGAALIRQRAPPVFS
jgi:hypothetical protein